MTHRSLGRWSWIGLIAFAACVPHGPGPTASLTPTPAGHDADGTNPETVESRPPAQSEAGGDDMASQAFAEVISVGVMGTAGQYSFSVGISSPDEGCERYADWWEVVSMDGELIYRRILLHSHVNEQPFERSGGPVGIGPDQRVLVRAHMNPAGYGGAAFEGTAGGGLQRVEPDPGFALELARTPPLPEDCAF